MTWFRIFNTLYFRIFFWFNIATIVLIGSTVWIASNAMNSITLETWNSKDTERFQSMSNMVESQLNQEVENGIKLGEAVKNIALQKRLMMILVDKYSLESFYAIPPPARIVANEVLPFINQSELSSLQTAAAKFSGPGQILVKQKPYALFFVEPNTMLWLNGEEGLNPLLMISISILFSGLLCSIMAWSVVKPIRALSQASKKMSAGDLSIQLNPQRSGGEEIAQLSHDFNSMAKQVSHHVNAQKQLLADISHELKSPLARQHIAHDMLVRALEKKDFESSVKLLKRAEKENSQLNLMISQLLMLSAWEAQERANTLRINLTDLLADVIADAAFEAAEYGKSVEYQLPDSLYVMGNAEKLASAFENIFRNAITYSLKVVRINMELHQNRAYIVVIDDGTGIDSDDLSHIFEPFVRVEQARDRNSGGTGLGLAIARKVILGHGGTIEAKNSKEKGLEIHINLPLDLEKPDRK